MSERRRTKLRFALQRLAIVLGLRSKPCSPPAALRGEAGEFRCFAG